MTADSNFEYMDDDIMRLVKNDDRRDISDEEDEIKPSPTDTRSRTEVFQIFERALTYVEQQSNYTAIDGILMHKWRDYTTRRRITAAKQSSIDSFFKK